MIACYIVPLCRTTDGFLTHRNGGSQPDESASRLEAATRRTPFFACSATTAPSRWPCCQQLCRWTPRWVYGTPAAGRLRSAGSQQPDQAFDDTAAESLAGKWRALPARPWGALHAFYFDSTFSGHAAAPRVHMAVREIW